MADRSLLRQRSICSVHDQHGPYVGWKRILASEKRTLTRRDECLATHTEHFLKLLHLRHNVRVHPLPNQEPIWCGNGQG